MITAALILGFVGVFVLGAGVGAAIMRARYRSQAHFAKAIEDARMQGRLERDDRPPGLEPPQPW